MLHEQLSAAVGEAAEAAVGSESLLLVLGALQVGGHAAPTKRMCLEPAWQLVSSVQIRVVLSTMCPHWLKSGLISVQVVLLFSREAGTGRVSSRGVGGSASSQQALWSHGLSAAGCSHRFPSTQY